ncbi:hypothetical protein OEA41_006645 [Lepraria neglecta]|uniref:3-oxoacyl-[acyl-carrier-protein] reductase n=1 Tax=Lepraria neglecta TaxID=209136 RepID=A0AAD9Z9A6_9LECA|nr:hypothetical protein OEA41_006645 [Lepraria neglecta]
MIPATGHDSRNTTGWGNGTTTIRLFARQGAIIFRCNISLPAAEKAASPIRAENPSHNISVMHGDATSSSSVRSVVDACIAKYGRIDILVNNVGRSEPGGPPELTEEVWDAQTDINLKSVYLFVHLVLPILEKQDKGSVVVKIASVAGLRYIAKLQVALNAVVPGLINTPVVKVLADKYAEGNYEAFGEKRDEQDPMGKM